jgi:hypothetical protein
MIVAFVQRLLTATITRNVGNFTGTIPPSNSVTLSGLRMSAKITNATGMTQSNLSLAIFGMTLDMMNDLSTLGLAIQITPRASIVLSAGNVKDGMTIVFQGNFFAAWADFQAMPEVAFRIEANSVVQGALTTAKPTSFQGNHDAATALAALAKQMGLKFENNGVSVQLSNSYLSSNPWVQALEIAEHANVNIFSGNGVLSIWPKNSGRTSQGVAIVSSKTGMDRYPTYTANGILVRTLFNPALVFGGKIQVISDLKPACGIWCIYKLDLDLDCMVPNGQWFETISAYPPGVTPTPS